MGNVGSGSFSDSPPARTSLMKRFGTTARALTATYVLAVCPVRISVTRAARCIKQELA